MYIDPTNFQKLEDEILRKSLKKRDESYIKKYPGMHEIAPFFLRISGEQSP